MSNNLAEIVNGSLWTVPFEMACYIVMAVMIITKFIKNGFILIITCCIFILFAIFIQINMITDILNHHHLGPLLHIYLHSGLGHILIPCFLLGAAVYQLRDVIPFDRRIFILSALVFWAIGFCNTTFFDAPYSSFLLCPLAVYSICFVGLCKIPPIPFYSRGDYSYGIYLYGFPIQQALFSLFPGLRSWPVFLFFSIVFATMFASFSWHVIEKPILQLRKGFSFAARLQRERSDKAVAAAAAARMHESAGQPGT